MLTFELVGFDVVVVPFPYSDRLAEKRRPAVVVSVPNERAFHGHLWLAMITSSPNSGWPGDVPIQDLALAGLSVPCIVRTAKITTVEAGRIIRRAGQLDAEARHLVRHRIIEALA